LIRNSWDTYNIILLFVIIHPLKLSIKIIVLSEKWDISELKEKLTHHVEWMYSHNKELPVLMKLNLSKFVKLKFNIYL